MNWQTGKRYETSGPTFKPVFEDVHTDSYECLSCGEVVRFSASRMADVSAQELAKHVCTRLGS